MIIDLSNMSNSISIIPSGQRGISNSKHYTDLLEMYLKYEYHSQYFGVITPADFQLMDYHESKITFKPGGA
jgi:acyl-homoserine lactone acylase PvdQ